MRKYCCFAALTMLAHVAAAAQPAPLRCDWAEKQQCEPTKGCTEIAITTYAKIDLQARLFERCDQNGCDAHVANVSGGGNRFTNVDVPGSGMFLKLAPDQMATEVVSIGNTILISHGICKRL